MADDNSVTDDEILTGFKSLQQAMSLGFERQTSIIKAELSHVRNDISALEHRTLRRFDEVDVRLERVDARLDRVEARLERVEARIGLGEA